MVYVTDGRPSWLGPSQLGAFNLTTENHGFKAGQWIEIHATRIKKWLLFESWDVHEARHLPIPEGTVFNFVKQLRRSAIAIGSLLLVIVIGVVLALQAMMEVGVLIAFVATLAACLLGIGLGTQGIGLGTQINALHNMLKAND